MQMRSDKHTHKKIKRKKIFETILSILILLAIVLGGFAGYYGSKVVSFLDGISSDSETVNDAETIQMTQQLEDLEPFSAVILGTDVVDQGTARSDTIIVTTVNPKEQSMKMVSIPRDTLITLPNGVTEKINAAFATGGPLLARAMISNYLNIPIDFFATMDFRGLVELVDAVGGITVNSDLEFSESNYMDRSNPIQISEGIQELDGAQALGYARMRKKDPRGDFGRQQRQREVIIEVLDKLVSFRTIANLTSVLNAVEPYLSTNATSEQMLAIAGNYAGAAENIEQLELKGADRREYVPHYGHELYVWEPFEESMAEVQHELRVHLELEEPEEELIDSDAEIETANPITEDALTE